MGFRYIDDLETTVTHHLSMYRFSGARSETVNEDRRILSYA